MSARGVIHSEFHKQITSAEYNIFGRNFTNAGSNLDHSEARMILNVHLINLRPYHEDA